MDGLTYTKQLLNFLCIVYMRRLGTFFLTTCLNKFYCSYMFQHTKESGIQCICNSYTMDCPPVRGDNPRALASGLSYVQVDKHGITIIYHLHQCRPCTARDISC